MPDNVTRRVNGNERKLRNPRGADPQLGNERCLRRHALPRPGERRRRNGPNDLNISSTLTPHQHRASIQRPGCPHNLFALLAGHADPAG